jgi:hypothetical protein
MRALLLTIILTLTATAASAQAPNARAAYVERRGLIEADGRCQLFARDVRAALEAGAGQARGTLLRAGWSRAQLGELEQAVAAAASARRCDDPRTLTAATDARAAFGIWTRANEVAFEGWARIWRARRVAGADGWRLRQEIAAPLPASFGVRELGAARGLVLIAPSARGAPAPSSARLIMRDAARTAAPEIALQQLVSHGLDAGAPAPGRGQLAFPSTRSSENGERGARLTVFAFPDAAFANLLALDPRESVEILVQTPGRSHRLLVEVGDIAAARAFLTIGAN